MQEKATKTDVKIAVLIPCFNEAKTIGKVVSDFKRELADYPNATVYVYDNNSTDNTAEIAVQNGAVLNFEYKQGKGNVIRRMFREIDADCYILVDGDDTYPAAAAKEMINAVLFKKADMVVGDRLSSTYFKENKRAFHGFGNTLVRRSVNKLFHSDIQDIMTGYRAFSRLFVKSFPVLSKGFEIETEMTIHAIDKNMQTENVIIEYRDRPEGSESKLNTYSDGAKVLLMICRMFAVYKPFTFWSLLSVLLTLISSLLMMPVFGEYFETGQVPRFPTLIGCGFLVLTAVIMFFSGVILQTLRHKEKADFEFKLQQIQQWGKKWQKR